jgi:hypothetical protein
MQNHPVLDADLRSISPGATLDPTRAGAGRRPLAIHPLVLVGNPGAPYLLLHEALASKALEVTETERGTVNVLVARNAGDHPSSSSRAKASQARSRIGSSPSTSSWRQERRSR